MVVIMTVLSRTFYQRNTVDVARDLLGKIIVRKYKNRVLTGMIVETEAYRVNDPACHAYKGKTNRNSSLFGTVGHAYVYMSYGIHFCLNLVSREPECAAGGVLIRALEPLEGIDIMQELRSKDHITNLMNGPGKLTQAFGIERHHDGIDVTQDGELYIIENPACISQNDICASPRIGISQGLEKPWRFYYAHNQYVSKKQSIIYEQ